MCESFSSSSYEVAVGLPDIMRKSFAVDGTWFSGDFMRWRKGREDSRKPWSFSPGAASWGYGRKGLSARAISTFQDGQTRSYVEVVAAGFQSL
jgi:hypothetical protein